jgi:tripartite-type tricarboxylate transporter receptor subunit TctC
MKRLLAFRIALCVLVVAIVAHGAPPASAQSYPTQTITFQVAFAAGGIADVVASLVGQKLSERLGQTVVVENCGGAGGNLAARSVSGAPSDGYAILATTTSLAVNETALGYTAVSPPIPLRSIPRGFLRVPSGYLVQPIPPHPK